MRSARVGAVVFDLDGTLIDSGGDIAAATVHALASHGFLVPPLATLLSYVGDGARPLLARSAAMPSNDPRLESLYASFIEYYTLHPLVHTRLCSGALRAIEQLSHLPLAICTNKPRVSTERVLAALGLGQAFHVIVAGNDLPRSKPDPLPIEHIANALGMPNSALVMVGDGSQDVQAGRAAGARTVGVRGGIQSIERLLAANPDVLIDSLDELPALIEHWQQASANL